MNKNTLVLTSLLIALMALAIVPVQAFHHPSTTDDLLYEQVGPRPNQILCKIYGNYPAEYLAFKAQEIDLMDWPLAAGDYDELENHLDPTHALYNSVGYKDFGVWEIDINNQQYPTDLISVRKALSYMIDKRFFINTYIGATVAVKADSPSEHLAGWYNPYCDDLYNIVTRNTVIPFPNDLPDFAAAYALLVADLGPPHTDPENPAYVTWLWPEKPIDPHGYVNLPNHLLVFARSDDPNRAALGAFIKTTLEVDMPAALLAQGLPRARIHVDLYTVPKAECKREVMCEYRYHLYTGGWGLTRDPDNLAFCYASYQCWKPVCYSPNDPCYMNPLFDEAWDNAEAQPTAALAVPYVWECQKILMDDAAIIPVWLTAGYKAYLSTWDGVVSMAGRGPHNTWTLMDAHLSAGTGAGDTLRYGFVNDAVSLNPVHGNFVWDWYVMENIYDTLISFNPYDVSEDIPWMASGWEIGTWDGGLKTKLTFHLRSDIYWQDVPAKADRKYGILPGGATGVPVTTKDVAFSIISIRDNPDGWNQFLVADVGKVEINDAVLGGAQMIQPYPESENYTGPMDVYGLSTVPTQDIIVYYNILSPWITLHWVGGLPILPYHIWYWVPWWDADGDGTIDTWLFDPEVEKAMQGSGPYIFTSRTPGILITLTAYKEVYHIDPDGTVVIDKHGYFNEMPVRIEQAGSITVTKVVVGEVSDNFQIDVTFKVHNWGHATVPANTYKYQICVWNPTVSAWKVLCSAKIIDDMVYCIDYAIGPIRQTVPANCVPPPGESIRIKVVVYKMDPYAQEVEGPSVKYTPGDCAGTDPMAPPYFDGKVFWQDLLVVLVGYGATPADARWALYNLPRADMNLDNQIFWQDLLAVLVNYGQTYDP
jgi:ABC-type transport system substrate-binding protein